MYRYLTIFYLFIFFFHVAPAAAQDHQDYVIIFDHLYNYGENTSTVLRQYITLKSAGQEVLLLPADQFIPAEKDEDSIYLLAASSFEPEDDYRNILGALSDVQVRVLDRERMDKALLENDLMLAIDKVYPFSDLNKLMDVAELLHQRDIDYIVSVMPVYDNYELEAFDNYIRVLDYVQKRGGSLFIHYPVENPDGIYNTNPRPGLERALNAFRKRGLEIAGITVSQNKMFTNLWVFDGLNLPFILATEDKGRINGDIDLLEATEILNPYILLRGTNIHHFNFFGYREHKASGLEALYFSIDEDEAKLFELLNIFNAEKLPIKDFKIADYTKLQSYDYTLRTAVKTPEKTQIEQFLEEEIKKITGENLEQEQQAEGFDISRFSRTAIRVALVFLMLLMVLTLIGRHYEVKKFYRK